MPVDLESKQGITTMYREYFPKIYNFVYYRVHDHGICGDIVSDVFLKVLEHAENFDSRKAGFSTWIFAIARHAVIDYYRVKKSDSDIGDYMDTLLCSLDFEDAYRRYTEEKMGDVESLVEILNEKERQVIHMRYFQGYSGKETAQKLGMNESSERTVHERALKKMMGYLKSAGVVLSDLL